MARTRKHRHHPHLRSAEDETRRLTDVQGKLLKTVFCKQASEPKSDLFQPVIQRLLYEHETTLRTKSGLDRSHAALNRLKREACEQGIEIPS